MSAVWRNSAGGLRLISRPSYEINIQRSVNVIRTIASKYGAAEYKNTLTMLQLLNEPKLSEGAELQEATKRYYRDAYAAARYPWSSGSNRGDKTHLVIVLHNGFMNMDWWNGFDIGDGGEDDEWWLDDHYYQSFDQKYYWISAEEHLRVSIPVPSIFRNIRAALG